MIQPGENFNVFQVQDYDGDNRLQIKNTTGKENSIAYRILQTKNSRFEKFKSDLRLILGFDKKISVNLNGKEREVVINTRSLAKRFLNGSTDTIFKPAQNETQLKQKAEILQQIVKLTALSNQSKIPAFNSDEVIKASERIDTAELPTKVEGKKHNYLFASEASEDGTEKLKLYIMEKQPSPDSERGIASFETFSEDGSHLYSIIHNEEQRVSSEILEKLTEKIQGGDQEDRPGLESYREIKIHSSNEYGVITPRYTNTLFEERGYYSSKSLKERFQQVVEGLEVLHDLGLTHGHIDEHNIKCNDKRTDLSLSQCWDSRNSDFRLIFGDAVTDTEKEIDELFNKMNLHPLLEADKSALRTAVLDGDYKQFTDILQAIDVYQLGKMMSPYTGNSAFIRDMQDPDWEKRPSIRVVLAKFDKTP